MTEWRPVAEFVEMRESPQIPGVVSPGAVPMQPQPSRAFAKDPTALTSFLKVMLWISIGLATIGLALGSLSLATGNATDPLDQELSLLDVFELLLGLGQLVVYIVTGVALLMWIHRANRNARALGAKYMTFSPGWSVGWCFIPILNLWKPYQAMKEIWQASANPDSWASQDPPSLVGNWWGLWLVSNFLGQMSFRLALRAETEQALLTSAIVSLGGRSRGHRAVSCGDATGQFDLQNAMRMGATHRLSASTKDTLKSPANNPRREPAQASREGARAEVRRNVIQVQFSSSKKARFLAHCHCANDRAHSEQTEPASAQGGRLLDEGPFWHGYLCG